MDRHSLAGLVFLLLLPLPGGAQSLTVFELSHRSAEELIPLVQPLLGEGEAVSGQGRHLLLRANPPRRDEVDNLLQLLDVPPRRLLITVRQLAGDEAALGAAGLAGHGGRLRSYTTRRADDAVQQVQVVDGGEAYIDVGQEVPRVTGIIVHPGDPVEHHAAIDYTPLTTGFYVRPRIAGEGVTVEVRPHRRVQSPGDGGRVQTQALATTVSGRLGEWLSLGGADRRQVVPGGTAFRSTRDLDRQTRQILLKVEALP